MGSCALKTNTGDKSGGVGKRGAGRDAGDQTRASLSAVLRRLLLIVLTDVPLWHPANGWSANSRSDHGEGTCV